MELWMLQEVSNNIQPRLINAIKNNIFIVLLQPRKC